jgi:hypothetical protein
MRIASFAVSALALAVLLPGAVRAGTLVSPAVEPPVGGLVSCYVVNAGSTARTVHIEIRGVNGTTAPLQMIDQDLEPGDMRGLALVDDLARYCRFSFKGSKKTLRASAAARDASGTPLVELEAH